MRAVLPQARRRRPAGLLPAAAPRSARTSCGSTERRDVADRAAEAVPSMRPKAPAPMRYREVGDAGRPPARRPDGGQVDGHELALFLVGSEVRCLDGLCPHEGGPMAQGDVVDGVVTCPWHGWAFRMRRRPPTDGNGCALRTYPVKVEDGRIPGGLESPGRRRPRPRRRGPRTADGVAAGHRGGPGDARHQDDPARQFARAW